MKIRGTYGDSVTAEIEHESIEILAEDGRVLYTVDLKKDGSLEVHTSGTVKHNGVVLDSHIAVTAKGVNWFKLSRCKYA